MRDENRSDEPDFELQPHELAHEHGIVVGLVEQPIPVSDDEIEAADTLAGDLVT